MRSYIVEPAIPSAFPSMFLCDLVHDNLSQQCAPMEEEIAISPSPALATARDETLPRKTSSTQH
eukprot:6077543-Amphidinium_carterae.2